MTTTSLGAAPPIREQSPNTTAPMTSHVRRPKMSASRPPAMNEAAKLSMYPLMTHCRESMVVSRSTAI